MDDANRLRQDKHARQIIEGARWLLLKNPEHLTRPKDQVRLRELLNANRALLRCYLLKDDLKELWAYKSEAPARHFRQGWDNRAPSTVTATIGGGYSVRTCAIRNR